MKMESGLKCLSTPCCWLGWIRLTLVVILCACARLATAQCDLRILSAGPCVAPGTNGTPSVGDTYSLYVNFDVQGTPDNAFRIAFTLANATWYSRYIKGQNGWAYTWQFSQTLPLDDAIPWSVTLDPDGISGDTNLANNVASGMFTPIPPSTAADLYSPRLMHGSVTSVAQFEPGGRIEKFYVLLGEPSSHGAQSVIDATGSSNGQSVATRPYGEPVFQVARTNILSGTFQDTNAFRVQLNNIRVNPTLLRAVTWGDMKALATNWTQWLRATPTVESTDDLISKFVQEALPPNYKSVLTPYDTARTLHRAVMKNLTNGVAVHTDAVGALQDGVTDCDGFASLLTACLRNAGVPARVISGFSQGDSEWHELVEFHLPGCEWLLADPTLGNAYDSTGAYAYYFGYDPVANNFLAVDAGELHELSYCTCGAIEQAEYVYDSGKLNSYTCQSSLQPNGFLTAANFSNGSFQLTLNDAPTNGSVVIDGSTNLAAWSPLLTNSAAGVPLNFSFPAASGNQEFYRARIVP